VFRALDEPVGDEAVGEMNVFVRAEPVSGEILVVRAPIDREGPPRVIETDHVVGVDVVRCAGVDPLRHSIVSFRICAHAARYA
jgi:hypothetical protein